MREQLIQYVNLLFAGAADSGEIREEILQNTLDRYDDLISQGKTPEAAYRLAITGIGDINEILNSGPKFTETAPPVRHYEQVSPEETDTPLKKILRAAAVALYILCPVPLFILSELGMSTIGLCGTLALVAVATVLIILGSKKEKDNDDVPEKFPVTTPQQELRKSVSSVIWSVGLAIYLILSFLTGAWYITWILFPVIGCVKGLANAIMDLKEAVKNEN